VLVLPEEAAGDPQAVEALLAFLSGIERPRRPPVPALYVAPPGARPTAEGVRALIDDRPVAGVEWPPDPDTLLEQATDLIDAPVQPRSLRDRARIEWVRRRVELLYAGLDLPQLRVAIDPRNAARPVLLLGEQGTGRALLARYIHHLSEPTRHRFVRLALDTVPPGELEEVVLARTAGSYSTLYVHRLEGGPRNQHVDLAALLMEEGGSSLETVRWILATERQSGLAPALRMAPWIRVELPPLRGRPDFDALVEGWVTDFAERAGRTVTVSREAMEALRGYAWPGNLRELDAALHASLSSARADELRPEDLRIAVGVPLHPTSARPKSEGAPPNEKVREKLEEGSTPAADKEPIVMAVEESSSEEEAAVAELYSPTEEKRTVGSHSAHGQGGPQETTELATRFLVTPLAEEIRTPVLALRATAGLLNQQPNDPSIAKQVATQLDSDLQRIDRVLERVERFCAFAGPERKAVDLAELLTDTLQHQIQTVRNRGLVVLEEPDRDAPHAYADEEQLRFALDAILDRALRMVPQGGDLYVGSRHVPQNSDQPARHRILIRFHSPEEVLAPPDEAAAGGVPLEILLARALIERIGGDLSVDISGPHDNLVLIQIPS
jgi:hypothetical protein